MDAHKDLFSGEQGNGTFRAARSSLLLGRISAASTVIGSDELVVIQPLGQLLARVCFCAEEMGVSRCTANATDSSVLAVSQNLPRVS